MKQREAKMIPKLISLRVEENKISITYSIMDAISENHIDNIYINFNPSKDLMNAFEKEIEIAIKNHKKNNF